MAEDLRKENNKLLEENDELLERCNSLQEKYNVVLGKCTRLQNEKELFERRLIMHKNIIGQLLGEGIDTIRRINK